MTGNPFDDILPPASGTRVRSTDTTPTAGASILPTSIREIDVESTDREDRRKRRAERRTLEPTLYDEEPRSLVSKIAWWVLGIVILASIGAVSGFIFFAKTTVSVTPLQEQITQSGNIVYTAYAEPEGGELGFVVITKDESKSQEIKATGTAHVERYASGTITVYNNFSTQTQKFIKNTRFESTDGKIYRVRNSIVVPGKSGTTPGSIDVVVYADEAGEKYNIENARLTVPGLKEGNPDMYAGFYAETKGNIAGGFVGDEPAVDDAAREAAVTALKNDLSTSLPRTLKTMVGSDALLIDDFMFITFDDEPATEPADGALKITVHATAHAITFKESALARTIGTLALATLPDGLLTIPNRTSATFNRIKRDENPWETGVVQFTVTGPLTLRFTIDTDAIARDLVGKPSTSLDPVMTNYPGAKHARAIIRPFWRSTFPDDARRIVVSVEEPTE